MTLADLLGAVAARVRRIDGTGPGTIDLVGRVYVEREIASVDTETLPFALVLDDGTNFERQGALAAGMDSITDILICASIESTFEDREVNSTNLQMDLLAALFTPPAGGDAISNGVSPFDPVQVLVIRPEQGETAIEVQLTVRATWCDEILNNALEARP